MAPVARMATADDSRFLAEMMYASMLPGAGRGLFDEALAETGVAPVDFHEALLLAGANNWGQIADFIVLESEETLYAGAAGAYLSDRPDRRPLTAEGFEAVRRRLSWTAQQSRSFWRAYVRAFGLFGDAPQLAQPAAYVIEYIAVPEALRGLGYARMLLDAHAMRARAMGHDRIAISAMFGNDPALAAYLRCGFREHARLGPERFGHAFPGMVRLVRDLQPSGAAEPPGPRPQLPPRMTA
jgi:GNAT superfamily N-acetyltransferase